MITYYSDFKDISSINNPLMDNNTEMRYSGFFDVTKNDDTPYFGTSLTKTLPNKGAIFCDDSSRLFSITSGYVNVLMSLPNSIIKGVYSKVRNSNEKYLIWGVNVGQLGIGNPGLGVFLSQDGVEFLVHTSAGLYTIVDKETTAMSDTTFELEFLWDGSGITGLEEGTTMLIRSNGQDIIGGSAPIIDDLDVNSEFYTDIGQTAPTGTSVLEDASFYLLENAYGLNNLHSSMSRLIIEDEIPQSFILEH